MALETWEASVFKSTTSTDDFPENGSSDVFYVLEIIVSGTPQQSWFYWNGGGYSTISVGPKPHPHS